MSPPAEPGDYSGEFIVVTDGGRFVFVAEFDPEYLSQKTGADHWRHLQVLCIRTPIKVKISDGNLYNVIILIGFAYLFYFIFFDSLLGPHITKLGSFLQVAHGFIVFTNLPIAVCPIIVCGGVILFKFNSF